MSHRFRSVVSGLGFIAAALSSPPASVARFAGIASQAPVAAIHPKTLDSPAGSRMDNYYWIRDDQRKNPEMLAYLNAENAYTDSVMAHTKAEQDSLYEELTARLKPDDLDRPGAQERLVVLRAVRPRKGLSRLRSQEGIARCAGTGGYSTATRMAAAARHGVLPDRQPRSHARRADPRLRPRHRRPPRSTG